MTAPTAVSAPGKLLLIGEYAVLDGGLALVAATRQRVYVRLALQQGAAPSPDALSAEMRASKRIAQERLGLEVPPLHVDVGELWRGKRKLGLGSSAAASVAVAGFVYACAGRLLTDHETRKQIFEDALAGHASVAPLGSGADIAASTWGQLLQYRRCALTPARPEVARMLWPDDWHVAVVWSGSSARTSGYLHRLAQLPPHERTGLMKPLSAASAAFIQAVQDTNFAGLCEATSAFVHAELRLEQKLQAAIVTAQLRRIASLAGEHGGVGKPSGAGGGDSAVVFFAGEEEAKLFSSACTKAGFVVWPLSFGAEGISASEGSTRVSTQGEATQGETT